MKALERDGSGRRSRSSGCPDSVRACGLVRPSAARHWPRRRRSGRSATRRGSRVRDTMHGAGYAPAATPRQMAFSSLGVRDVVQVRHHRHAVARAAPATADHVHLQAIRVQERGAGVPAMALGELAGAAPAPVPPRCSSSRGRGGRCTVCHGAEVEEAERVAAVPGQDLAKLALRQGTASAGWMAGLSSRSSRTRSAPPFRSATGDTNRISGPRRPFPGPAHGQHPAGERSVRNASWLLIRRCRGWLAAGETPRRRGRRMKPTN